jgi:hypothetical protein
MSITNTILNSVPAIAGSIVLTQTGKFFQALGAITQNLGCSKIYEVVDAVFPEYSNPCSCTPEVLKTMADKLPPLFSKYSTLIDFKSYSPEINRQDISSYLKDAVHMEAVGRSIVTGGALLKTAGVVLGTAACAYIAWKAGCAVIQYFRGRNE